jgi:uncharacterized protein YfaQ (DUF2300 family)
MIMEIVMNKNLKPQNTRTKAEQRKIAIMGGKASGKARREKKLLSQIYADVLADLEKLPKGQNLKDIVKAIIKKKKPHSVSMLKEMREATEGTKNELTINNFADWIKSVNASKTN